MRKILLALTITLVAAQSGYGWSRYEPSSPVVGEEKSTPATNIPAGKNTGGISQPLPPPTTYTFSAKGLPFSTVLEMLQKTYGLEYYVQDGDSTSLAATPAATSGASGSGSPPPVSLGAAASPPPSSGAAATPAPTAAGGLNQPVWGNFKAPTLDDLVRKICKAVDYYCTKNGKVWKISKFEYFETDLPYKPLVSVTASNGADGFQVAKDTYDSTLIKQIQSLLSPEGRLVRSPSGYLVVIDRPSRINMIRRVVETDRAHERPIKLSVKVLSFTAKKNLEHGIDWSAIFTRLGRAVQLNFTSSSAVTDGSGTFSFKFNSKSYESFVKLLSQFGNVKIIKSTTLTVMAGTPQSTVSVVEVPWTTRETSQTNAGVETALKVNFKTVGLKVKIFPQVIGDDEVVGTIYAETSDLLSIEDFGDGVKAPKTSLSSALVNFTARVGQSIVITGLRDTKEEVENDGIPLLKDLPIVGDAFSYKKRSTNSSEIIVIVTPLEVGE